MEGALPEPCRTGLNLIKSMGNSIFLKKSSRYG
jgi:hypothetical protein